jgi:transcriptional regulator with XRE-family HTH domain/signal peptidase I
MIGKNLIFLRKRENLKQSEMLTVFGVQNFTWSDYERGKSTPPIDLILKISDYFLIDVSDFVTKDLSELRFTSNPDIENTEVKGKITGKILPPTGESEVNAAPVVDLMPKVITVDSRGEENMVLVPIKAAAGYLNGHGDMAFIQSLPAYRLPGYNNGTFRMFEVKGASMHPTLNEGDICICKWVESLDSIRNDRIHVVVCHDGIVVKRVLNRVQTDNKLILKSDNIKDKHEYPNMIIEPSEVLELWYVVAYISHVMKSPSEIYNRVIDLEGRLTIMDDKLKKAGL